MTVEWPVELRGVTESVVATLGPNDRWNLAALGLRASSGGGPVTARTWGNTRTRRNFIENEHGHVQFTRDLFDFVEAALSVREQDDPALASADARVEVSVEPLDEGETEGTSWVDWALTPEDATVECEVVPTTNRGYYAVVEGTVVASRLDVSAYDTGELVDRLIYFESVVGRCGAEEERASWDRLRELVETDW